MNSESQNMEGGDKTMERDMRSECYGCVSMREVPGNTHIQCVDPDTKMTGNPHGIKHGWFYYPLLFDPVWKDRLCRHFEPVNPAISQAVSEETNAPTS